MIIRITLRMLLGILWEESLDAMRRQLRRARRYVPLLVFVLALCAGIVSSCHTPSSPEERSPSLRAAELL